LKQIMEEIDQNNGKISWAINIRNTQTIEEQAKVFYESYRIVLSKEDYYKQEMRTLESELRQKEEELNLKTKVGNQVDQENARLRYQMNKLEEKVKAL